MPVRMSLVSAEAGAVHVSIESDSTAAGTQSPANGCHVAALGLRYACVVAHSDRSATSV
jgi:hypothetical protein